MKMSEPVATNRRRTRKKPGFWENAVGTLAKLCLWAIVAVILVAFAEKIWQPVGLKKDLEANLAASRAEKARYLQENAALRRRIQYLQTDEGVRSQARKLGYINGNEVPLRAQEPPPPPPAQGD
jgi:cell division protein FtsB